MTVLEKINAIVAARPLERRHIEEALDVALREDADNANPYFSVFRSFRVPSGTKAVEVRLPTRRATRKDGMLIVDLDAGSTDGPIDQAKVREVFGKESSFDMPTPRQPAADPAYLVYSLPWGSLRFGFARPALTTLTTIVVDADK